MVLPLPLDSRGALIAGLSGPSSH